MRRVTEDHTSELYKVAFNQVCDPEDWKGPIDCEVPYHLANLYMQAIEFMTGVKPEAEAVGTLQFRLTCIGYAAGPCA